MVCVVVQVKNYANYYILVFWVGRWGVVVGVKIIISHLNFFLLERGWEV